MFTDTRKTKYIPETNSVCQVDAENNLDIYKKQIWFVKLMFKTKQIYIRNILVCQIDVQNKPDIDQKQSIPIWFVKLMTIWCPKNKVHLKHILTDKN